LFSRQIGFLLPHDLDQFLLDLSPSHGGRYYAAITSPVAGRRTLGFVGVYVLWIAVCAILFLALRHAEDPSRRAGRILSNDASARAVAILRQRGFRDYEAVHVAYATRGEGGPENRWIVLCDRVQHTALRDALVVELRAADGTLLVIRKPVK